MAYGRFPAPPANIDPRLLSWMRAVEGALSRLPFSVSSTTNGPNVVGVYGNPGDLLVDVGSTNSKLWQKRSASTSTIGWSAYSWI